MTSHLVHDWSHPTSLLRRLENVAHLPTIKSPGKHHDVVITAAHEAGEQLFSLMGSNPGGCGPIIAEEGHPWMYWIVPLGTKRRWANPYGAWVSAPWRIPFPPTFHKQPLGPYWLRRFHTDVRVTPDELSDALHDVRPAPVPYQAATAFPRRPAVTDAQTP
ncbi:hypothetical protein ACH4FA_37210 [Streptomyces sp. NPDC017966]|uniref:hypothetical protein n=1 Tax=unclassified Streptomyces TaxID=2593676 RepID=UPI0037A25367